MELGSSDPSGTQNFEAALGFLKKGPQYGTWNKLPFWHPEF